MRPPKTTTSITPKPCRNRRLLPITHHLLERTPTVNRSQIAEQALRQMAKIYAVEREVKELGAEDRLRVRQEKGQPLVQTLHDWLMLNRQKEPAGSLNIENN